MTENEHALYTARKRAAVAISRMAGLDAWGDRRNTVACLVLVMLGLVLGVLLTMLVVPSWLTTQPDHMCLAVRHWTEASDAAGVDVLMTRQALPGQKAYQVHLFCGPVTPPAQGQ